MKISDYYGSDYLTVEDLNGGTKELVVAGIVEANVKERDGTTTTKLVVHFRNSAKGMMLGTLNAKFLSKQISNDTDDWGDWTLTLAGIPTQIGAQMMNVLRVIAVRKPVAQQTK